MLVISACFAQSGMRASAARAVCKTIEGPDDFVIRLDATPDSLNSYLKSHRTYAVYIV